jgi:hypothetical protein
LTWSVCPLGTPQHSWVQQKRRRATSHRVSLFRIFEPDGFAVSSCPHRRKKNAAYVAVDFHPVHHAQATTTPALFLTRVFLKAALMAPCQVEYHRWRPRCKVRVDPPCPREKEGREKNEVPEGKAPRVREPDFHPSNSHLRLRACVDSITVPAVSEPRRERHSARKMSDTSSTSAPACRGAPTELSPLRPPGYTHRAPTPAGSVRGTSQIATPTCASRRCSAALNSQPWTSGTKYALYLSRRRAASTEQIANGWVRGP